MCGQAYPRKDIWCWMGFTLEELVDGESGRILDSFDVLVDGPFVEAMRDIMLAWRGCRNQRVIRLAERRRKQP